MATRAKFRCVSVTKREGWSGTPALLYDFKFQVVHGNNEENKSFFASTPTGEITLGTVREDHFVVGQEYYVDFADASPAA